jgi:DNA anti-recombination protein RmuC
MVIAIAEDMKKLTEDIISSHDLRVKTLGGLVSYTHDLTADTRKAVKGFSGDRKKMAQEQAKDLNNFVNGLSKDVQNSLKKAQNMVKEFHKTNSQMSKEQAKSLSDFVNNLTDTVRSMLNSFEKDRGKMSKELRDKLTREIKDINTEVGKILGEADKLVGTYHAEMSQAKKAWKTMSAILAKEKKSGFGTPRMKSSRDITTVGQAVGKDKGVKKDAEKRKSNE